MKVSICRVMCLIYFLCIISEAYSQSLENRSTIIIEQQTSKFRVTLLIARKFLGNSEGTSDQQIINDYFKSSIGMTNIYLGGQACEWGDPSGNLSPHAVYLQIIAFCMKESSSSKITWQIDFLKKLPKTHPTIINLLVKDQIERFTFVGGDVQLSYHPTPVNEAFSTGLSFIGLNPKGWTNGYGEFVLPLGLWILFFTLYLNLSENRFSRGRRITLVYCLFFTLSLLASFLWQWWIEEVWATAIILISMLAFFVAQWMIKAFRLRLAMVATVGTIHGFSGLSMLPSLPKYFGATSLFASFQIGAILGIWLGVLLLGPCLKWITHALPQQRSVKRFLKVLVFILSTLMLVIGL